MSIPPNKPRGVVIAGNWKMNLTLSETQKFWSAFSGGLQGTSAQSIHLYAPAVNLAWLAANAGKQITVGAQNAHGETHGAFTGELSASLLKDVGVHHALVGHSERRHVFGETLELVQSRTLGLLKQGMSVLLCVGETRSEREAQATSKVLESQLASAMTEAIRPFLGKLMIAYEPVWAIGTGLTATPAQAEEAHQIVRRFVWNAFGMEAAAHMSVLYGGSVTPENIAELLKGPNVDGALVGGASLKAESFIKLVQHARAR